MPSYFPLSSELAPVRASGPDTARFLQAQLTADLARLDPAADDHVALLHTAWCNPKGRVISTLYVTTVGDDHWLIVPRNLLDTLLTRLKMFVMRAKVTFESEVAWQVIGRQHGISDVSEASTSEISPAVNWLSIPHSQREIAIVSDETALTPESFERPSAPWRADRIQDGEAWIDADLTEQLLPEHLNLDLTGAVSFTKGCFPGQEVVARMHYKGKQKVRLFCLTLDSTTPPAPGHRLVAEGKDQSLGQVIESVTDDDTTQATVTAPVETILDNGSVRSSGSISVELETDAQTDTAPTPSLSFSRPSYWV